MKVKLAIELPGLSEVVKLLEQPNATAAEDALGNVKKQATDARTRLSELGSICRNLPDEIIAGRARSTALEEVLVEERSGALQLKAIDKKVEAARAAVEAARAEGRDMLLAEAAKIIEHLKKTISPVLPVLELVQSLEYEIERCVDVAFLNPLTGTAHPRKQLPALEWPQSLVDEQSGFSWREGAISKRSSDEK